MGTQTILEARIAEIDRRIAKLNGQDTVLDTKATAIQGRLAALQAEKTEILADLVTLGYV